MSILCLNWAFSLSALPPAPKVVLLALADQANDAGRAWPKQESLALKSSCSKRTLIRHLKFLESVGLVTRVARSGQTGRKSNVYQLHLDASFSAEILQSAKMTLCENSLEVPVDNFPEKECENTSLPREHCKVPNCHFAEGESSQSDNSVTSQSDNGVTLQYIRIEPPIEPPTIPGEPVENSRVENDCVDSGSGVDGVAGHDFVDQDFLAACMPPAYLRLLGGSSARTCEHLLREAVTSGWRESEIYGRLSAQSLPDAVLNGAGLVIYRLRDVLAMPVATDRQVRDSRLKRSQRDLVSEVLAGECDLPLRQQVLCVNGFLNECQDLQDPLALEADLWLSRAIGVV